MSSQQTVRGGLDRGRGWRGTARSRGGVGSWRGSRSSNPIRTSLQQLPPPQALGPTVDAINANNLLVELDAPTIEDVSYVASYNWVNGKSPVILVPGSPPAWSPPAEDTKLKPDSEDVFRDINAARYPSYPMEPAIRAVIAMKPDFELQSLDVVGCGSTLGNILRCAGAQPRAFRFDIDVVGDTVFFVRRERSPTALITDIHGYGHTFPEAYTTWDAQVRNSCSHQRIIKYDFGGLQVLIRTETDGYVKQPTHTMASSTAHATGNSSLEATLGGMAVSNLGPSSTEKLEIRMTGTTVPQEQIFDIKTRANYKRYDMEEILPRLWANQTPKFLIAYHQLGLFDKPAVAPVMQDILKWQIDNSSLLAHFHALVKRIVNVVRDSDHHQFEVSWDGDGPLRITKQIGEGRSALPSDLLRLWETIE